MKAIKLNRHIMPVVVTVALLGTVWIAKGAGVWQTSGRGQILLDASGQPDPQGIKGWMTLTDLSQTYDIPLEALYVAIGTDSSLPADTALKDLEGLIPSFGVSGIRVIVAAYRDGAWNPGDGQPVLGVSHGSSTPQPSDGEAVQEHSAVEPLGQGSGRVDGQEPAAADSTARLPGSKIKGRMTLQAVSSLCQIPAEVLSAELGLPDGVDVRARLSSLVSQLGLEVQTIREVVDRYHAQNPVSQN